MEKHREEETELYAPLAACMSPILFSDEEDNDTQNAEDGQEITIVLFRNDRSPVHCVSSEDLLSSPTSHVHKFGSRSYSPSCSQPEEETELVYNSPTLLLEISSSSSSASIPEENNLRDNFEEQSIGLGAWTSSDNSSECACGKCDPRSVEEFICNENSPSERIPPHYQGMGDGFTYMYNTFGVEMIQAVHSLRYPVEVNNWAVEYLNNHSICCTHPVMKTTQQCLELGEDQYCDRLSCDVPGNRRRL